MAAIPQKTTGKNFFIGMSPFVRTARATRLQAPCLSPRLTSRPGACLWAARCRACGCSAADPDPFPAWVSCGGRPSWDRAARPERPVFRYAGRPSGPPDGLGLLLLRVHVAGLDRLVFGDE